MSTPIVAPLSMLALRRAAPPLAVATFAAIAFALARDAAPPRAWLGDPAASDFARSGLARDAAWTWLAVCGAPWLAWKSARAASGWRGRDSAWLVASGLSPWRAIVSTWCGLFLACAAVCAAAFAAAEFAAEPPPSSWRRAADLAGPGERWVVHERPVRWSIDLGESVARESVRVACALELAAGGGAACEVELVARRDGTTHAARTSIRERGAAEVDVGAGGARVDLELRATRQGDRAFIPSDGCVAWVATGARAGGLAAFARALAALAAISALALGLATWTSPAIAAAGALACAFAALESPAAARWLAGADFFEALDEIARGRSPGSMEAASVAGSAAATVAALALARAGWSREGRSR